MKLQGGMMRSIADCSKGQFKIQEMAFVVVMVMVFFGISSLVLISIIGKNSIDEISLQRTQEAKELIRKIAVSPELSFNDKSCESCLDMDKAMAIKYNDKYKDYWDLDLLKVVVSYPERENECTPTNFPDCGFITLVDKGYNNYEAQSTFVALCRYEYENRGYPKCDFGRVIAAGRSVNSTR